MIKKNWRTSKRMLLADCMQTIGSAKSLFWIIRNQFMAFECKNYEKFFHLSLFYKLIFLKIISKFNFLNKNYEFKFNLFNLELISSIIFHFIFALRRH